VRRLLALWFGLEGRIDRRTYLLNGAFLMAVKFAGDAGMVRSATGRWWTPLDYLSPSLVTRFEGGRPIPGGVLVPLALWALPFLWIGVSMSLRRIRDAGWSPWIVLFFFVPLANWALILVLLAAPSRALEESPIQDRVGESRLQAAFKGIASGVVIGLVSFGLQAVLLHSYNAAIFLGTPFTMGAAAGWFYNRPALQPVGRTARLGALTIAIAALGSLLFAFEGLICIAMALPPDLAVGMFGAVVGRAIRGEHVASRVAFMVAVAVPGSAALESRVLRPPLREVVTSIEIPAAPEVVWPHVIQFRELSEEPAWFFRRGIAYPTRARIEGTGPGAVRREAPGTRSLSARRRTGRSGPT